MHGNDPTMRLADIAGYYNKNNPDNQETMLVFFDHTDFYGRDDQAINFVALAVHELRTPLTMLRGYIEALEEDLHGTLSPELDGYMRKLKASAQQLASFVNNVLNVARIEEDQMMLSLQEAEWGTVLQQALEDVSLRASVHGISIAAHIQPGLPTVGIDRVSIAEVINNLIDNAIKYSGQSKEIVVSTGLAKDGTVETTVRDFGVGIPSSALPHLFEKFYRDHHNKQHVGGTGIGLYLCKKLIGAHGGNIWVQSKEGEGSTFAFTLMPYAQLAEELKNKDNNGIVRSAHGWIKNHSMYRR
jgi:signal transduction histidine kinase